MSWHIIELGVGAGRNAILLGNLLKATGQHGSSSTCFDSFKLYKQRLENWKRIKPWKMEI